ncbi:MAG: YodL domain-containing protein [Hungatella hathewayi]|uniref:YodL domain-containing protein n=1 Tax=Hungatella TaxID=1649459 RepID=UPI0011067C73|nr:MULTISPECIES: YodL domain-containing protein [Hungatella]MCI7380750.1 YodL domain-containing protein [Hungatella sp.]MDY6235744.1 YodL domain-containing protein [Hungatella hathewayi]
MGGIKVRDGIVEYFGNLAGYVEGESAVIDTMFENEVLKRYLEEKKGLHIVWENGVYDRLAAGVQAGERAGKRFKDCRIYQIKADALPEKKFLDYAVLKRDYGEPERTDYQMVYQSQMDTNDLEEIYDRFDKAYKELPSGFSGRPISISDVIELYDSSGSRFYYVDHYGFEQVAFEKGQIEAFSSQEPATI